MIDSYKKELVDGELYSIKILTERAIKELENTPINFKHVIDSLQEAAPIIESAHNICDVHGSFEDSSDCYVYVAMNVSDMQERLIDAFNKRC